MNVYKLDTVVTEDGKIILPSTLKKIFKHQVKILLIDREKQEKNNNLKSVKGILHKYAKSSNIKNEKNAWLEAAKEKHAIP